MDIEPIELNIIPGTKNDQSVIELRKYITNRKQIKEIIKAGFEQKPIIIYPKINNRFKALIRLTELGYIKKINDKGDYTFIE